MKALIIGAGNAGRNLAAKLCAEKHDVVVVDSEPDALSELDLQMDIMTVQGWGASPRILEKAGLRTADLVVAVTNCDEVNILACRIAQTAGVRYRVARISNEDFLDEHALVTPADLGVDLAINPRKVCAQELANILLMSGTQEVVDFLEGRVTIIGFKVSTESPLLRAPIRDFPMPELLQHIRFIAYQRGAALEIPYGDTHFQVGDDVYAVGERRHITPFLDAVYPDKPVIRKVVIAGGGGLGLALARLLDHTELEVVLLDRDEVQADRCAEVLDRALVIRGDVMTAETREHAGITEYTAFVATTGNDENNIIGCLLAQKDGASLTVAQVSQPDYVPVINNLSLLDRAVSPHLSMINSILHFVRGKNVRSASLLHTLPGELLDVVLSEDSPWAGRSIAALKIPRGAIIATVLRAGEVRAPVGDLVLVPGDRVLVFCLPEAVNRLRKLCCS